MWLVCGVVRQRFEKTKCLCAKTCAADPLGLNCGVCHRWCGQTRTEWAVPSTSATPWRDWTGRGFPSSSVTTTQRQYHCHTHSELLSQCYNKHSLLWTVIIITFHIDQAGDKCTYTCRYAYAACFGSVGKLNLCVCFRGNYEGERPYVEGDWCSRCPENLQKCENNLCGKSPSTSVVHVSGSCQDFVRFRWCFQCWYISPVDRCRWTLRYAESFVHTFKCKSDSR